MNSLSTVYDLGAESISYSIEQTVLFKSPTEFSHFIEQKALDEKKTCTEVLLEYCDYRDIEPDEISKLVSPSLKGKLYMEMVEKGYLQEHNTLE